MYPSIYEGISFHENCLQGENSYIEREIPISLHVKVIELQNVAFLYFKYTINNAKINK
jgi:hypothetical protein